MFLFKRDRYWHVQYFDDEQNRVRRKSTKKKIKSEAMKFLSEFKPQLTKKPTSKFILLSEFRDEYLSFIKDRFSKGYVNVVEVSFKQLINYTNDLPLYKLSIPTSEKFIAETFKRTKEGARTYYIALKSAFNKAERWGYLFTNPFNKITLPKIPKNYPLFITEEQLNYVVSFEIDTLLKDIYLFAFYTGMRRAEITNLQLSSIDLDQKIISVSNTETFTTKGKRERIIPMYKTVVEILQRIISTPSTPQDSSYVFTVAGKKLTEDLVTKRFKKCVRAACINPKFHFHDLRHSFASWLVRNGVSIYIVSKLLGHQDTRTTEIYSHLRTEDLMSAVNKLNN